MKMVCGTLVELERSNRSKEIDLQDLVMDWLWVGDRAAFKITPEFLA
jgi:hypothetical protein